MRQRQISAFIPYGMTFTALKIMSILPLQCNIFVVLLGSILSLLKDKRDENYFFVREKADP